MNFARQEKLLGWTRALALAVAAASTSCTDERTGARATSPSQLPSEGDRDAAGGGEDAQAGSDASNGGTPAPQVRFVGRMDTTDPAGPRFAWSGSGAVAAFRGSSVTLTLNDTGTNQFTVLIDGELQPKLIAQAGRNDYPLGTGLPPGDHRVEVYRRTEASFGPTQFLGFEFGADGALLVTPAAARRIEIIGDSVSAGYGDEGTAPTCPFSADTENHYATYGAISARELGAELITVAWSGKGVVNNYGNDVVDPMPSLYGRTLPQDASSAWDFSLVPDAVVINLGTNDFSTDGDPTVEAFADEYRKLLERVRSVYPEAFILCTVGPLLSGTDLDAARAGIAAGVAAFEAGGGGNARVWEMNVPNANPGCDYHPGLATHQAMADALTPELRPLLE